MARVSSTFLNTFETMEATSLEKPVLFVVDMINGFVKQGALHDEAILSCVIPIKDLITSSFMDIIFVADAHTTSAREFQSFPTHCLEGSEESEIIDELRPLCTKLYYKNSTNTFFSPQFQGFLENEMSAYQDIILVGCCSDICILQFALSLQAYCNEHTIDKRIVVPIEAIDTYHIEGIHDAVHTNEFAIANMSASGIHVVRNISRGK